MYCVRLHTWWSTNSLLTTLISSLIARRRVKPQTLWVLIFVLSLFYILICMNWRWCIDMLGIFMRINYLSVWAHIRIKGEVGTVDYDFFYWQFQGGASFTFVFNYAVLSVCLFLTALWLPARKGLTSLVCAVFLCFITLPYFVLGQVWYLTWSLTSLLLICNLIVMKHIDI